MRPYRSNARHGYTGNDPQLMDDDIISAHEWDAARAELGPWSSDAQIERRALQLAREAIEDNDTMAESDMAESRMGDWT